MRDKRVSIPVISEAPFSLATTDQGREYCWQTRRAKLCPSSDPEAGETVRMYVRIAGAALPAFVAFGFSFWAGWRASGKQGWNLLFGYGCLRLRDPGFGEVTTGDRHRSPGREPP